MDRARPIPATSPSRPPSRRCRPARAHARYGRMEERGCLADPDHARSRTTSSRRRRAFFSPPRTRKASPISSTAAARRVSQVLDDKTIGFADFAGNRQYITQGNLAENPKAHLFLIDYAHRQRIKIWGEARVVEGDAELMAKLMPEGYKARPEQAILFTVSAWDANCPQHIPQRFEAADVAAALADAGQRIEALETEMRQLRQSGMLMPA